MTVSGIEDACATTEKAPGCRRCMTLPYMHQKVVAWCSELAHLASNQQNSDMHGLHLTQKDRCLVSDYNSAAATAGANLAGVGDIGVCSGEGERQIGKVAVIVTHEHEVAVQLRVQGHQVIHVRVGVAHLLQEEACQWQLYQHTLHSSMFISIP